VATTFPIVFAQPDDLVLRPADEPEGESKPVVLEQTPFRLTVP
jgi:hypothetical protein